MLLVDGDCTRIKMHQTTLLPCILLLLLTMIRTIIDMDLLQWYDALKLNMPSLSMAGFLKAVVQFADSTSVLQVGSELSCAPLACSTVWHVCLFVYVMLLTYRMLGSVAVVVITTVG